MRMISTVDLYCVFNRARGLGNILSSIKSESFVLIPFDFITELISPQDLMTACQQFESQSLDYRLRSFQSGAIFVQAIECSDDKVSEKVLESVTNCSPHGLSAVGLSQKERISVVLAKEQLLVSRFLNVIPSALTWNFRWQRSEAFCAETSLFKA